CRPVSRRDRAIRAGASHLRDPRHLVISVIPKGGLTVRILPPAYGEPMNYKWLAACFGLGALTLGGCPSVTVDSGEGAPQPTVEFDPANKIIPFPNNLLLDPATGKVALPEQCNESATS